MGVSWHKSGVRFSKPSLAKTELVTIVAFGKRTPDQIRPDQTTQLRQQIDFLIYYNITFYLVLDESLSSA